MTKVILSDLKISLLKKFEKHINNVILFGSYANKRQNEYSDYDILVVLDDKYNWRDERRISDICYSIDLKYNIFTDVHIISNFELNSTIRGKDPIFTNALKNGIYA